MKKNLYLFVFANLFSLFYAQVGINTETPNGATVLDITSTSKGILIPRLTDLQRDATLADNNTATVPPAGVVNSSLAPGTLIFNTTQSAFQFWDGTVWRQLFVATSSQAGNDGVVKVNGGNGGAKPNITLSASGNSYGAAVPVTYTTPLTFASAPTTSWPETTVPFPGQTANIYIAATNKWRENEINGQVHLWRLITRVTPGASSSGAVRAYLTNPDSGFLVDAISLIPSGSAAGTVASFYFYTIADPASLDPGRGYVLYLQSNMDCTVEVDSFTRVSLFKD